MQRKLHKELQECVRTLLPSTLSSREKNTYTLKVCYWSFDCCDMGFWITEATDPEAVLQFQTSGIILSISQIHSRWLLNISVLQHYNVNKELRLRNHDWFYKNTGVMKPVCVMLVIKFHTCLFYRSDIELCKQCNISLVSVVFAHLP